jgi:multiple antibiotic resistance protein
MDALHFALLSGVPLMAIMNPVAALPAFIAMTPDETSTERVKIAMRACLVSAGVLITFSALGMQIFSVFGISMGSFRIAGGLVLLLISLDSLQAKRTPVKETAEETREGRVKEDVSITPLAVPMLAGPGAMSTVIVLKDQAQNAAEAALLYGVILTVSVLCFLTFLLVFKGFKRVNPIVMNIVNRLTGLLLAAAGIEFIVSGLKATGLAA